MAKARPEHNTADEDEPGTRGDFDALASRREWKQRLRDLIETYYSKTPLNERQWWKLREIADECAKIPGNTKIDDEKRNHVVDFLCRAIFRGEFKDDKGRMQVAYLHPSPLAPMRLDVKWLDFDQLLKLANDLFVRRKECIESFSRNNIDVPRAWLPRGIEHAELALTDDQATRNPPPAIVEEYWKVIEPPRSQREHHRARRAILQLWPSGPPVAMSKRKILERIGGDFSASTVNRLLKRP
jgi:hypothetical protein